MLQEKNRLTKKDYILTFSIVINVILFYLFLSALKSDQKPNEELFRSKGRVEILNNAILYKNSKIDYLTNKLDSLNLLIDLKPKERLIIKSKYYEKINNIVDIPIDSGTIILSIRLSEINIDR